MTNPERKRFRLRFSIRTLVILITVVCCYAACWGPTKKWGIFAVENHEPSPNRSVFRAMPVAPLFVSHDELQEDWSTHTCYYFWFFGYVAKLPYEREVD